MAAIQRPPLPLPIRSMPRLRGGRLALFAGIALVVSLAALQVQQFSAVTSTGYQIESLKRERLARQAENHELEAEVARLGSLARVDLEARLRLKMEPAKKTLYITVNQPLPSEQQLPWRFAPAAVEPAPAPESHPSVFERLLELLPF